MKIPASVRIISNKVKHATSTPARDYSVPDPATPAHTAPAARYGERAKLITLLRDCVIALFSKPPKLTSLLLVLALTLPATIAIISQSLHSAGENLLTSRNITVFLGSEQNLDAAQLAETLAANSHVHAAVPRLVDLQYKTVMAIDVQPAETLNNNQLNFIVNELNSHTSVDYVVADEAWLDRNTNAVSTTKTLRIAGIFVAALATSLLVYLLMRSELPKQRSEASVLHEIGASRKMVLKPLLLRGTLLAFFSATIGIVLAWAIVSGLPKLIDMSTYESLLPDSFPAIKMMSLLALAIFSSVVTIKLFVKNN